MFFSPRFTACCLVLFAASLTWGQSVRVVVSARGDVTITGTSGDDSISIRRSPDERIVLVGQDGTMFDVVGEGSDFAEGALSRTSLTSNVRFNLGDGDDFVEFERAVASVRGNLGRGNDECILTSDAGEEEYGNITMDGGPGIDFITLEDAAADNVRINLNAGVVDPDNPENSESAEQAFISQCFLSGSLTVNQTAGNSGVVLDNSFVSTATRITLGTGNDIFLSGVIGGEALVGSLYVNLGPGNASDGGIDLGSFSSQQSLVQNMTVFGSLTMIGGAHSDLVGAVDCSVAANASLNFGSGDDLGGLIDSTVLGNVSMNSGAGDDVVVLQGNDLQGRVSLNSSRGDDFVSVNDNVTDGADNWSINTGSGNDVLGMTGMMETRTFSAVLGAGDDVFVSANLDGGGGIDSLGSFDVITQIGVPRFIGGSGLDELDAVPSSDWFISSFEFIPEL